MRTRRFPPDVSCPSASVASGPSARSKAVLTAGLLAVLLAGCSSSDGEDSVGDTGSDTGSGTDAAAGIHTIRTTGGAGGRNNGGGGGGGAVSLYKPGGLGAVELLSTGAVDAGFTPTAPNPALGANALTVTGAMTIAVLNATDAEPAAGAPYIVLNQPSLYISNGNGVLTEAAEQATGLSVASEATLTLPMNFVSYAQVTVSGDIDNRGTITTADYDASRRGGLRLNASYYYGSGRIDTSALASGQAGGYVEMSLTHSFFNSGAVDTHGADAGTGAGGDGGYVSISAGSRFENSGSVLTAGGTSTAGGGGNGGSFAASAQYGALNSGAISTVGGDGASAGGVGGGISLSVLAYGDIRNSGALNASGGSASGGAGGNGGYIDLAANGGAVYSSGDLSSRGGAGQGTGSDGGNGGDIYIANAYYDPGTPADYSDDTPAKDILISGHIDTSGGAANADGSGYGGSGGVFDVWLDAYDHPQQQRLALLGYTRIDTSGGGGNFGGFGGAVDVWNDTGYDATQARSTPSGDVTNEVTIVARGGDVASDPTVAPANGGSGGTVSLATDDAYGAENPDGERLVNKGPIDTSGGKSWNATDATGGGAGGLIDLWGYNGLTNEAALTADGGADTASDGGIDGVGNDGGAVLLGAQSAALINRGAIQASGGDGEFSGGHAAMIFMGGATVTNEADITADGGNAGLAVSGSSGGDGGIVWFYVPFDGLSQGGTIRHQPGEGVTPGGAGETIVSSS